MKIQYSTSAICKVNFNSYTSGTHRVKLTAKPLEIQAAFVTFILKYQSAISGSRTSTFPHKICLRSRKELELPAHLGVEVDPQDGKSSRDNCNSACDESHDQQRFNRFVCVVSPQTIVKKSRPYSSPSTSKQSEETENCSLPPAKRPLIFNRSEPDPSTVSTRTETRILH